MTTANTLVVPFDTVDSSYIKYSTVVERYFAVRRQSNAFQDAIGPQGQRSAAFAATIFDSLDWKGRPVEADQPHAWPRNDMYNNNGYLLPSEDSEGNPVIPRAIADAICETCAWLVAEDRTAETYNQGQELAGVGTIRFNRSAKTLIPRNVWRMLKPFVNASGNTTVIYRV